MRTSLILLPVVALAALPVVLDGPETAAALAQPDAAGSDAVAQDPAVLVAAPLRDVPLSTLSAPAGERVGRAVPSELPAASDEAAAPLEPAADPWHDPEGLLLDAQAEDEAFAAHYAGLPIDGLVRQLHRVERLFMEGALDQERAFGFEEAALVREQAWLHSRIHLHMNAPDAGQRVPTPLATATFVRRHATHDQEALRILEVELSRRYNLLMRRAMDALHAAGKYKVEVHDPNRGPIG